MQLALPRIDDALTRGIHLPPVLPQFNSTTRRIFTFLWLAVLLLVIVGPVVGLYYRYTEPANNSQLLLGSRVGLAVSPRDATEVRFTVGPQAAKGGIHAGDHIVAVYGLPLPKTMPVTEEALATHGNDPAYLAMGNVLFGSGETDVPLTVRDPDGQVRDVTVTSGESHIDEGARALGISPRWLSFIDLLQVLFYPFLLWAAWLLHHRNSRDVVSSILSLAVLLSIAAEQPSSLFLAHIGVPLRANDAIYDLGNVLLLTGILLFPHGNLSWRVVGLIACLPILMFLHGQPYQSFLICFMIIGVLAMIRRLRQTGSSEQRQQIRWALFGISAYAVLRCISTLCDYLKWSTDSFGHQLLVEMGAGISFALAALFLQLGLLIALLRYRLYDAEIAIGRSVNFAVITLGVGGVRGGRRCIEADRLQLLRKYQQRRPDHLCGRARDDHGQPDPGTRPALVRKALPEAPLPAPQRPAAKRPGPQGNRLARRDGCRDPRAGRSRRARGPLGDDRQQLCARRPRNRPR